MEDAKVASILADEFNMLSREEEVNREDEECLELLGDKKRYLCNVMDLLGVNNLIDFEHKTTAQLKSGIEMSLVREGYWKERVEKIAEVIVERYNQAKEMIESCNSTYLAKLRGQLIKCEAARYLKLLGLGVIRPDGTAVVRVTKPTCDRQ